MSMGTATTLRMVWRKGIFWIEIWLLMCTPLTRQAAVEVNRWGFRGSGLDVPSGLVCS